MTIQGITPEFREAVDLILKEEWGCPPSISRGKALDTKRLPGFIALDGNRIIGVVTYHIEGNECEIATLNSFDENKGIGTALVNAVLAVARAQKCRRLWLVTTNDDIGAIRFYQLKGFGLAAAHINAMDAARKIKPSIPLIGMHNIPIKHELEFEIIL
jgi:ribosomal protein S18 acetylase RimI-like enzyme